jgi:hypothetical protein
LSDARGDDQEGARKRYSEVYQQRTEFMLEDATGYVWLYRCKQEPDQHDRTDTVAPA